jgi:hypothetical protein
MEAFFGAVALAATVAAGVVLLVRNSNIAPYYRASMALVTLLTSQQITLNSVKIELSFHFLQR